MHKPMMLLYCIMCSISACNSVIFLETFMSAETFDVILTEYCMHYNYTLLLYINYFSL